MTYEIKTEDKTRTFEDRDEFETMQDLLDDQGVSYETSENGQSPQEAREEQKESVESGVQPAGSVDASDRLTEPPQTPSQDAQEAEVVEVENDVEDEGDVIAVDMRDVDDEHEFVTQVANVPETFVVNMGTKNNKSPHITKTGYYYLAAKENLRTVPEPLNPTWEDDPGHSSFEATVYNEAGEVVAKNVGTAHLEAEDMRGAEANLDELAATRAATRALSIATGVGITSMEERIEATNE